MFNYFKKSRLIDCTFFKNCYYPLQYQENQVFLHTQKTSHEKNEAPIYVISAGFRKVQLSFTI